MNNNMHVMNRTLFTYVDDITVQAHVHLDLRTVKLS